MKSSEDRRAPEVRRVPLTTLVDICTQSGKVTPFQGESADLSGRGMSITTSYLPEVGEELVCRFHQDDQEILVEGRVAWRSEGPDSGEFGIQFTALDADSAHVLQCLGQNEEPAPKSSLAPLIQANGEDEEEDADATLLTGGERVKLHIEGLGAPMRACVHEGSSRKLRVGSSLEFLKVGRSLEIEDLNAGERRGAHVDMVNVVINPATSVPELVVQLRYDGVSPTPAPAKALVDYDDAAFGKRAPSYKTASDEEMEDSELSDDDPAPWQPAADALRLRLGGAMASAGQAAQKAGGIASAVAQSARASVSSAVAKRAGGTVASSQLRAQGSVGVRRRQTSHARTRTAPSYLRSGIHEAGLAGKHRPVGETRRVERVKAVVAPQRKARATAIFAAAFVLFGASAYGFRSWGEEGATGTSSPVLSAQKKAETPAPASDEAPKSAVSKAVAPEEKAAEAGIVAEVPLFGPQTMNEKPPAPQLSEDAEVEAEMRAAAAMVPDEKWEEKPVEMAMSDQKPWGNGRLYLPTIHRIRLDGAAASFTGSVSDDGFTVSIPGKKAMESGKSIQKRDKRIATVHSGNDSRGATIKFEFRGPIPAYRVRLRQDFVEFLISAPEETVARL